MEYRTLGNSSLQVSEVCMGTMTFGNQNDQYQSHELMDMALDGGVNFFDTAEMYPVPASASTSGESERLVGSWLAKRNREAVIIATKVIGRSQLHWIRNGGSLGAAQIRTAVEGSLKRLGTDYIDLYQIHWPDRYVPKFGGLGFEAERYAEGSPILETMRAMNDLITEGKIRYYGLSNETAYGAMTFLRLAEQYDLAKPVSIQNAYSLLNRVYEVHLAEVTFHENLPLLAYSPLAFGLLTGKYRNNQLPELSRFARFPNFMKRYRDKENSCEALDAYVELAGKHGLTEMALQFVASRPFCGSTIIGATSSEQLRQNLDAFATPLPVHLRRAIDRIHRKYPNPCP